MPKIIYHAQAQDLDYSLRIAYNILGDTMETRKAKMIINKSGGTASSHGKTYRVTIPEYYRQKKANTAGISKYAQTEQAAAIKVLSRRHAVHNDSCRRNRQVGAH